MSILVATDFSPCSTAAVRLAAAIARGRSVPLLVLHAVEPPVLDVAAVSVGVVAWQGDFLGIAKERLVSEARRLKEEGTTVETRTVLGDPVEAIRDAMLADGSELVVLGTHGRKGVERLFLGSVAEAVVRKATSPVLITGEETKELERWAGQGGLRLAVATDGSSAGEAALAWTGAFSANRPCDVSVVHLYWPPEAAMRYGLDDPWGGRPRGPELVKLLERDLRRRADTKLGRAAALRLRAASNDAAQSLLDEAALLGADGVVIGIPRHRSDRWVVVSPADVLRAASLPILCVPEGAAPAPQGLPRTASILLPTDFSEPSRAAIAPAYGLLGAGGGRVHLCTVRLLPPVTAPESAVEAPLDVAEREALETRLRSLIPPAAEAAGITTSVSVLEGLSVPDAILAAAERLGVDMVALGSHGRSGFKRAVLGSVADEVARRSPRPVLTVSDRARTER